MKHQDFEHLQGLSLPEVEEEGLRPPSSAIEAPRPEKPVSRESGTMELPSKSSLPPVPPVVPSAQPADDASSAMPTQLPAVQDDTPMIADDNDLIEKEWVTKAKKIVEHTKDDPYKQNKEMNKLKSGYIKKRYNLDVKLTED